MNISDAGIELLKKFEGCKLTSYPDPGTGGDPWTIGVGHTGPEVLPNMEITEAEADEFLRADVAKFEKCVNAAVNGVTQNQFDALVCLTFNIGCGALRTSTLLRKVIDGDDTAAADEFLRWNKAGGHVMAGLTRRREAERDLYLS